MENQPKSFFKSPVVIVVGIIVILCCCCVLIVLAGGVAFYQVGKQVTTSFPELTPIFDFATSTPEAPIEVTRVPVENVPTDTLDTLKDTIVPVNDMADLACRMKGVCDIPATVPSGPYKAGEKKSFWVSNVDTNKNFQVDATLQYVTDHVYFWVENGVSFNKDELQKLADTFETKIYPTDREFFGSEWTPGIDEDPHIYIVYAGGLGSSIAGYFSSADEVPPQAHKYSNAHEMFLFNSDNTGLGEEFTYGVLAHEFQHMIHWKQDRNESSWLNEGFSELAAFLNKYDVGGFDYAYTSDPDLQLTDWPNDPNATSPHYGASFLFLTYFLDRFGEQATQALVHDQNNGMDSVDDVLKQLNVNNSTTGQPFIADDVFQDWTIANYLHDSSVSDGRFTYSNYPNAPQTYETESFSACPTGPQARTVKQYGVDYIAISCNGDHTLHFEGSTVTGLVPENAHSGKYSFWSNKGDESDMTLTQEFDFTNVSGPIEMTYQTWYDLEKDYDYAYLVASTNGGKTWDIVTTPSCTTVDPSGNSYGCGYNGVSNGWKQETVDLSKYAGNKTQLRFEYVTDAAVNGEGMLIDDISIPAINYSTDFEADNGGWDPAGFARVENVLPQTYRLALIIDNGSGKTVQYIPLNPDMTADIPLSLGNGGQATLVVSGTTRFTREDAHYSIEVK
jgi:immune inhibitor A